MRVFSALLVAICLLPANVAGQTVQIRSGEHADFSRLTMTLPERVGWSVEPTENGAAIVFEAGTLALDSSAIFSRIPRQRLTDARWVPEGARLELSFGCDCEVQGFWFDEAMLVLDIADRGETAGPAFQETASPRLQTLELPESRAAALLAPFTTPVDQEEATRTAQPNADPKNDMIAETRQQILQQFSRAASMGLLKAEPGLTRQQQRNATENITSPEEPHTSPSNAADEGPMPSNLLVRNRIDLDYLDSLPAADRLTSAVRCFSDAEIDVGSWGTSASFGAQISKLRLELADDLDRIDQDAVLKLARLYLFFGFGAEAKETLGLLTTSSREIALLSDIADIAEQRFARPNSSFANQLDCDGAAALWSALSYERLPIDAGFEADAIIRAFNALPVHLRTHFGPSLARRFLDVNQQDISRRLLRIVDRPSDETSAEAKLAEIDAGSSAMEIRSQEQRLENIAESNSEVSATALITLIDRRIARGDDLSVEDANLVGALAFEKQNEEIAVTLNAKYILALAASRQFDQANREYLGHREEFSEETVSRLQTKLASLLTAKADDVDFIKHVLLGSFDYLSQGDPQVTHDLTRRLLETGFPDQALALVEEDLSPSHLEFEARRLLRAQAALALGEPRRALIEVLDVDADDAAEVRRQALSDLQNLAGTSESDQSNETSLIARSEELIADSLTDATEVSEAEAQSVPPSQERPGELAATSSSAETPLEQKRALLSQSVDTRASLAALLDASSVLELEN